MNSLDKNLILRSMKSKDVDQLIDNLKNPHPKCFYTPVIDRRSFNLNYQQSYGQRCSKGVWLGRKISHLVLIFWDGVIKNVINLFILAMGALFDLIFRIWESRLLSSNTNFRLHQSEKTKSLMARVYTFAQNFTIAFGHAYSMINDRKGRYYIDLASLEKHNYSYRSFHESSAFQLSNNLFLESSIKNSILQRYFDNQLGVDGLGEEKIELSSYVLNNFVSKVISEENDEKNMYIKLTTHILKGLADHLNNDELQKRFDFVDGLQNKLLFKDFRKVFMQEFNGDFLSKIIESLDEKEEILEKILKYIDDIKTQSKPLSGNLINYSIFNLYKSVFIKFLGVSTSRDNLKTLLKLCKPVVGKREYLQALSSCCRISFWDDSDHQIFYKKHNENFESILKYTIKISNNIKNTYQDSIEVAFKLVDTLMEEYLVGMNLEEKYCREAFLNFLALNPKLLHLKTTRQYLPFISDHGDRLALEIQKKVDVKEILKDLVKINPQFFRYYLIIYNKCVSFMIFDKGLEPRKESMGNFLKEQIFIRQFVKENPKVFSYYIDYVKDYAKYIPKKFLRNEFVKKIFEEIYQHREVENIAPFLENRFKDKTTSDDDENEAIRVTSFLYRKKSLVLWEIQEENKKFTATLLTQDDLFKSYFIFDRGKDWRSTVFSKMATTGPDRPGHEGFRQSAIAVFRCIKALEKTLKCKFPRPLIMIILKQALIPSMI